MDDTRQQLLDATWRCVLEGGVAGATSRAITSRAGANLGAITYHFGSKDELLAQALIRPVRARIEPALEQLRRPDPDPAARVLAAVMTLQQSLDGLTGEAPAYMETLVQSRHFPALQREVRLLFGELRRFLAEQMAEQRRSGYLPGWVDAEAMAALLVAVGQGVVLQTVLDPDGPGHHAMADQFLALLLAGRGEAAGPSAHARS